MIAVVDVYRDGVLIFSGAVIRQLRVSADGAVAGQIRGPVSGGSDSGAPISLDAPMQFTLDDGQVVEFRIYQAPAAAGGWGKFNGRVVG